MQTTGKTTDRRRRRVVPALGLMAWALLLAGCGSGDEQDADAATPDAEELESLPADPEATPPPTDEEDPGIPAGLVDMGTRATAGGLVGAAGPGAAADALEASLTRRIPAGTRISVTVDEEISTDLHRPGDAVIATVSEDVADASGTVLIPRGVKLLGRIEAVAGSEGVGELPVLEMTFETLSAVNREWPVEGAVISAPVVLDPGSEIARRFSRGRSGSSAVVPGKIAAGAVVVIELRAPLRVGPMVAEADLFMPGDSVPGVDTVLRVDTLGPSTRRPVE